jgi:hypothetical protein
VIELAQMATNPHFILKNEKELTVIFSESEPNKDTKYGNRELYADQVTQMITPSEEKDKKNKYICSKCYREYTDETETCYYHPGNLYEAETTTRTVNVKKLDHVSDVILATFFSLMTIVIFSSITKATKHAFKNHFLYFLFTF